MNPVSRYLDPELVEHLNQLQLSARSVVVGSTAGQHRSPVRGASIEFRQHRFYVPGDEVRRLDWRVLGRTNRPYVKEYEEETNLRCTLVVDVSGSMGYGGQGESKLEYALRLAAALSYLMLAHAESVGLGLCGEGLRTWIVPHAGPMQLSRVLEALERSVAGGESGLARGLHEVAERLDRRGLIIVLSDFFVPVSEIRSGLAHLRHDRHEVIAIQVVDRDEEEFPFRNWCRFRGLEGEKSRLCEPVAIRPTYLEHFRRHRRMLAEACLGLQVEFQAVTTDRPILDSVRLLVARSR